MDRTEMAGMKTWVPLVLLLVWAVPGIEASPSDWITGTPFEFIATGRFQTPSDGRDLLIVDKASGLARIGLREGENLRWIEQGMGIAPVTGLTTLRHGAEDQIASTSSGWNAVQLVFAGGSPRTLTSPVVGAHALVRLSTTLAEGTSMDDVLAVTRLGDEPDPNRIAAFSEDGTFHFAAPLGEPLEGAQFIDMSSGGGVPVLVWRRGDRLRVDRINRGGFVGVGFDVSAPGVVVVEWTAGPGELFSLEGDRRTLHRHRIASSFLRPGVAVPSGVSASASYRMPEPVLHLDTVPFVDPGVPDLRCLVAVRFVARPNEVHLYRLTDAPDLAAQEVMSLSIGESEVFSGLVTVGADFFLLSGVGGRTGTWKRYAQPAPGRLPVLVASGVVPPSRARAQHPNLFLFDRDPFLTEAARLVSTESRSDWTTVLPGRGEGESDAGAVGGLGRVQPLTRPGAGGESVVGNQLLASASLAGFGPVGQALRRTPVLTPEPGAYPPLVSGRAFQVQLTPPAPGGAVYYRLPRGVRWLRYEAGIPVALTEGGTLSVYWAAEPTGLRSPIVSGTYTFETLPALGPAAAKDANANGLSDAWERMFGLLDPTNDQDGDGFDAAVEQSFGTDPLDAMSRPVQGGVGREVIRAGLSRSGMIVLEWSEPYQLEISTDLVVWMPLVPQPGGGSWTEPVTEERRFYRLRKP